MTTDDTGTDDTTTDLVPPMLRTVAYMVGTGAAAAASAAASSGWNTVASVLGIVATVCLAVAVAYRPTRQ